ncbi:MAG: hypothetical protein R3C59_28695 [Planctomycetaceae bacterium]
MLLTLVLAGEVSCGSASGQTAILACAAHVDLNPIRAAVAETIEDSDYTSTQKRVRDLQTPVFAAKTRDCLKGRLIEECSSFEHDGSITRGSELCSTLVAG